MKVAFIGLGTMGWGMAANIRRAGHELTVHNRNRERELGLAELGAQRAASPKEAAAEAEIVITCVSDTPDVRQVLLGDWGVSLGARPGSLVVDMSTISPGATREMAQALSARQIRMLDAPVSGGSEGAEKGTLAIMVGGEATDLEYARPVLATMGRTITHVGPIGSGQVTKAINQVILAGGYLSVAEGMVMGLKAGLDMDRVVQAISSGAAGSWVLTNRSGNMVRNDYPLGFRLRLHHKDLAIAMEAARELGLSLPVTALVEQIEHGLLSRGHGDEDVSALARAVRLLSGLD